jgi:hypothetical protein
MADMCLDALDNEANNSASADDDDDEDEADDEWSDWLDWDTNDDSSVESANEVDMMLELTMNYSNYITRRLRTDVNFNKPPL